MVDLDDAIPALNQRPAALAIIIVFLILAYVCGIGRLYIRFFRRSPPRLGRCIAHYGLGNHHFIIHINMYSPLKRVGQALCYSWINWH
ncbi:hypothetical protein CGCS363_v013907 [Colletotrichum siamense]|uniref:uncharacterized protein n=1 Tax=Colletotrichum siamense TaxID=690259 RepID=UPI0018722ACC|nr:uncharacterized protein CGCS363_v013907 [Colletotrichum siamense]KAF5486606.1 hypothetical protein CGCS363_v013907 [Colletotrichum siamense]